MKKITKYVSLDKRELDTEDACLKRDALVEQVRAAIATLMPPIPDNIQEGWVQHDRKTVMKFKRRMVELALPCFEGFGELAAKAKSDPESIHPMSFAGRVLDDNDSPVNEGWRRLCCIDDQFREHNQPYFAINGPDQRHKQLNP